MKILLFTIVFNNLFYFCEKLEEMIIGIVCDTRNAYSNQLK